MSAPVPTTLAAILPVVQAQIMAWMAWPAERVLIMDPDELNFEYLPQADQLCFLWPQNENLDVGNETGAGRWNTQLTEILDLVLKTRFGTDEFTNAQQWAVSGGGLAHFVVRGQLIDCIQDFQPTDNGDLTGNTGNWLCAYPLKLTSGSTPRRYKKWPAWGQSTLSVEVKYQAFMTLSQQ